MAFVVEPDQSCIKPISILLRRNVSMCEPAINVDGMFRRGTGRTKLQVNLVRYSATVAEAMQLKTGVNIVALIESIGT